MSGKIRYLLIILIFFVSAVVYIDRSNISIAGTYLAQDYNISKIQLGWVFSSFLLGYAAFQIPAGWIVGKLGPRKVLTFGLIWWSVLSVATALVPASMANSLWVLIAVRFVLGLGESVAYPSSNQFIAAWFPAHERGKANGWVFGGVGLGSGTAPPLVAFIIYNWGWHAVFYASAAIGLMMAVLWYKMARDTPGEHPDVTAAEKAHIMADMPLKVEGKMPAVPWLNIFTSADVWGAAIAYVAFCYVAFIFHTWFFIYLKDARGLDLKSSALFATLRGSSCSASIAPAALAVRLGPPSTSISRVRAARCRINRAASENAAERLPRYDSRARRLRTARSPLSMEMLTFTVLPVRAIDMSYHGSTTCSARPQRAFR